MASLGDDEAKLKADLIAYQTGIAGWPQAAVPASADIVASIAKLLAMLDQAIVDIESKQGDHTYIKAKTKIDRLLELQSERDLALRTRTQLGKLSDALTAQATIISAEIRKKVQTLLDKLQTPMNDIYKRIQGAGAAPIRLELPAEDDTNQQRLQPPDRFRQEPHGRAAGWLFERLPDPFGGAGVAHGCNQAI
ncbi:hypothetical protein BRDID11002_22650 [Bradyrhizobium diazoefficiens]